MENYKGNLIDIVGLKQIERIKQQLEGLLFLMDSLENDVFSELDSILNVNGIENDSD